MKSAKEDIREIVFGLTRGRILGVGIRVGVFEAVGTEPRDSREITNALDIDPDHGNRLLRSLVTLGVLTESEAGYSLTPTGEYLSEDHTESITEYLLFETSELSNDLWKHLPELIADGEQNTFVREFGQPLFEYLAANLETAMMVNDGMRSYSRLHATEIRQLLSSSPIAEEGHACDIGGGHGYLLCMLLSEYQSLTGTVYDQSPLLEADTLQLANEFGVANRCSYACGDMFEAVPHADMYLLKHIIHDWSDIQAIQLLSTVREQSPDDAQLLVIEHVIPNAEPAHFGSLYDMQMIVWADGRERTVDEYKSLLNRSGWKHTETNFSENKLLGAIHATTN